MLITYINAGPDTRADRKKKSSQYKGCGGQVDSQRQHSKQGKEVDDLSPLKH